MVAGNGEAEQGGGIGATPLEERVRRLEKDVEELREQARAWASEGMQNEARVETTGEPAAPTAERLTQREPVSSPFAEATRSPVRRSGGNVRAGAALWLFPEGLPSATWWVARAGVVLLIVGVSFLFEDGCRARMAHASRASGRRRGHWRRALCLRVACQNLPSRILATARGRRCRGVLSSAFGAWSVWQLVPYAAAFAFCVLTTAFAFAAAVRLNAEWLALLGVMGGYATPFMLLSPDSKVPALVVYSLLLLGGYLMVYVLEGAAFGVWHCHPRNMGDSRRVRPRHAHLQHLYRRRTAHLRRVVGVHGGAHRLADDTLPHQCPPLPASGRQGKCLFGDREERQWSPDGGGCHQRRPARRFVVRVERVAI